MPVIQFPNDWRNWQFQEVFKGGNGGSGSGSDASTGPALPIFSGYFWIYLGLSIAFTLATIVGWWWFTSTKQEIAEQKEKLRTFFLGPRHFKHLR